MAERASLTVSAGLLGLSTIAGRLTTLAVLALLARGAGAEAVGFYGIAAVSATVVGAALSFGLVTYLTREVAAGGITRGEVARLHAGRLGLLALAAAAAWPVASSVVAAELRSAFLLIVIAGLLDQGTDTAWVLVRGTRRAWVETAANGVVGAVLVTACALDAARTGGLTVDHAARYVLVAAIVRSVAAVVLTGAGAALRDRATVAPAARVRAAFPYLAADLLGLLYFRGDVFVLALFVTAAELGAYVAAAAIVGPAVQVAAAMGTGALAYAAGRGPAGPDADDPVAVVRFFRAAGQLAAGALLVALPVGVAVLFGAAGGAAVLPLTAVLGLFLALRFANYGLSALLLARGRAAGRLLVLIASIAANVALNLLLDGRFGAYGAAWSTVLTELVVAASLLWFLRDARLPRPVLVGTALVAGAAGVLVVTGLIWTAAAAAVVTGLVFLVFAGRALVLARDRLPPAGSTVGVR